MVEQTKEAIGEENIVEYLEPSAGAGVFLDYFDKPYLAYDIEPEDERIVKHDYLKLDLEYKKGRCIIGNPPFGDKSNDLVKQFWYKSVCICDYISFILPISQHKNNINLFEFDLVYSEDLGLQTYTDRELHCCFNIYKRPNGKTLNKKPTYKLKDITIKRHTRNSNEIYKKDFDYDLRICCRGSLGKICEYENQYAKEYCIKIHNEKLKDRIFDEILSADWNSIYPSISSPYLAQWQILRYLKEQIPELE